MTMFALAERDQEIHVLQIHLPTVVAYPACADTTESRIHHTNQMDVLTVKYGEKFVPHLATTVILLNPLR